MTINYQDLIKEQFLVVSIPVILIIAALGASGYAGVTLFGQFADYNTKAAEVKKLSDKKSQLETQLKQKELADKLKETKEIFTIEGEQFSADASFAPLFDEMLTIAKDSGIKIRSVDYNYSPEEDPFFKAKVEKHNVCELDATIVGRYTEIQRFLKTMLAQPYLVNLDQLEIVSWQRDKSVLVAQIKLVFYTKTL